MKSFLPSILFPITSYLFPLFPVSKVVAEYFCYNIQDINTQQIDSKNALVDVKLIIPFTWRKFIINLGNFTMYYQHVSLIWIAKIYTDVRPLNHHYRSIAHRVLQYRNRTTRGKAPHCLNRISDVFIPLPPLIIILDNRVPNPSSFA